MPLPPLSATRPLSLLIAIVFSAVLLLAVPPAAGAVEAPPDGDRQVQPPASGTACQTGPRYDPPGIELFDSVPTPGPGIALTFDMDGDVDRSVEIMNVLVELGVCATIFLEGGGSLTGYGQQVTDIIAANPDLFEVGNHTMHHCDLVSGSGTVDCPATAPGSSFIQQELTDAGAIIRDVTGLEPLPYWRPPYGAYNSFVLEAAAAAGYTKTFMWDIDTRDWEPPGKGGPSRQEIIDLVLAEAQPGSIVLFHLSGWHTADALYTLVPELRARGLLPTSLSHLLSGVEEVTFVDIDGSIFYHDILWAYRNGVTAGCGPDRFCPRDPVLRDQMASFLVRALGLTEGAEIDYFADDDGNQHEANINRLAHAGIARGCGDGRFCPRGPVLRDQMASFLARALGLTEGAEVDYFADDEGNQHEGSINRIAHAGISRGCAPDRYCPGDLVRRGQMTAFLHRAVTR